MLRIFYTGVGCKKDFIHTEKEFLQIMRTNFDNEYFTIFDWIAFSGAEIYRLE
jgi:hypothetical protein